MHVSRRSQVLVPYRLLTSHPSISIRWLGVISDSAFVRRRVTSSSIIRKVLGSFLLSTLSVVSDVFLATRCFMAVLDGPGVIIFPRFETVYMYIARDS